MYSTSLLVMFGRLAPIDTLADVLYENLSRKLDIHTHDKLREAWSSSEIYAMRRLAQELRDRTLVPS